MSYNNDSIVLVRVPNELSMLIHRAVHLFPCFFMDYNPAKRVVNMGQLFTTVIPCKQKITVQATVLITTFFVSAMVFTLIVWTSNT